MAQFATSYEICSKPKKETFENGLSKSKSKLLIFGANLDDNRVEEDETYLPKFIQLDNLSFMKARTTQSVIRLHKKKKGADAIYAELLLFYPWKNET